MARHNEIGKIGENVAEMYLKRMGFTILTRNFRKPYGEIDIVAEKGGVLRFVEVKSVSREIPGFFSREINYYRPEEQVHPEKIRRLERAIRAYITEFCDNREYQIDVVGILLDEKRRIARCRLFENVS
ncbi:YraN family protein [Candidatus Kaiserbacteria bacterium]|nr:YraN family protein [Candidatus Kaiserbacteria bacterium]